MITRIWFRMAMCVLIALSATACCCWGIPHPNPFRVIEPSDLVGTWRAKYDEDFDRLCWYTVTGVETLTLRADGTYQQVYDDGKGYVYTSPWNRWYLEGRRGDVVLHLEGGRFYPLGIEDAEKLANGRLFYHSDDDGRGNSLDLDGTEAILNIAISSHVPGWFYLYYPPVCDLDLPVFVEFYPIATSAPTPTAVP